MTCMNIIYRRCIVVLISVNNFTGGTTRDGVRALLEMMVRDHGMVISWKIMIGLLRNDY